jgi:hypothetical protein
LSQLAVGSYVDNGREGHKAEVRAAHTAARAHGVTVRIVDLEHATSPLASSPDVRVRAVLPAAWPPRCELDANECSIGLRLDYCSSSILFTGDAQHDEEPRVVQRDGGVNMGGLALAVRVYARLDSDPTPLVEGTVEPEAGLVLEEDGAATGGGFFLIAGNVVRSHAACRSRSARARRLRGRCTENPS